jgi:hypothetical protein
MTLRKALLLFIGLATISALVACSSGSGSSSSPPPPPPTIAISATGGSSQSAQVGSAFGTQLQATVTSNGSPASGVKVTFAAPSSGASCTLANASVTTNASGVAATGCTANSTQGTYNVTASTSGASANATFGLTNTAVTGLAAGNYIFYVSGTDTGAAGNLPSPYILAGAFSVNGQAQITGGLQDFSDFNYNAAAEAIVGGSIASSTTSGDSNVTITLNTNDTNIGSEASSGAGNGVIVLDVSMASATRGLAIEYDSFATGKGEVDLQSSTGPVCPSASVSSPCSYAFAVGGLDSNAFGIAVGGVIEVDSVGGISGNGSVFDVNDFCGSYDSSTDTCSGESFPDNALSTSSVGSPSPNPYGFVTFTLNSGLFSANPGIVLDGYIVDANHIFLVENWSSTTAGQCNDALCGTTGGLALAQTGTGTFQTSSISGSNYVVSLFGSDDNGALQSAGVLAFNSNGTSLGGDVSFNDLTVQNTQGGEAITGGSYTVDAPGSGNTDSGTGRVTVTGATDTAADFLYDLQLYLDGNGHALVISMDAGNGTPDVIGGPSWQQAAGLNAASFSGNYAYASDVWELVNGSEAEADGVGIVASNGSTTISGFADENETLAGPGLTVNGSIAATYATTSTNGVFNVTGGSSTPLTAYIVDDTQGVIIENDNVQLMLGNFTNH